MTKLAKPLKLKVSLKYWQVALFRKMPSNFQVWLKILKWEPDWLTQDLWDLTLIGDYSIYQENRETPWGLAVVYFKNNPEATINEFQEYQRLRASLGWTKLYY